MRALAASASGLLISAVSLGVVSGPAVHQYPIPPASGSVQLGGGGTTLFCPEPTANSIARISTDGSITQRHLSNGNSRPLAIARESDAGGRIIFTETGTNRIGIIDANGNLAEYDIPTPASNPKGIAAPGVIWFTEYDGNRIGSLNPPGAIVEYDLPTPDAGPLGIATGPGATQNTYDLWFTEFLANKIGRIDPNGVITEYSIPTHDSGPTAIAAGSDSQGNVVMYFTESKANKIGRISDAGVVNEFAVPTSGAGLSDIVQGNDGMWFSERFAGKLGRFNVDGTFDEFALPGSRPDGIAITYFNPDGSDAPQSVWWIDGTSKIVGRLSENRIYAVGAGHDATFDTEFDFESSDGDPLKARVGIAPLVVCPPMLSCETGVEVDVPGSGTVTQLASDIPITGGIQLYMVTARDLIGIVDLPVTQAFRIDEGNGARAEFPLVDYWTLADTQPPATNTVHQPKLTFPARRASGVQTDLILSEIESAGVLNVRIQAVLANGGIVATTNKSVVGTLVMSNVLKTMGLFGDFDGHLVVTRQSSSGLFWGLTEVIEGDTLILAPPGSELDNPECTTGPAHCNRPRTTRVVTRGSGAQTVHEDESSPKSGEDRVP
jgi:virginiamycin B lyase